jgi:hypothetical protein
LIKTDNSSTPERRQESRDAFWSGLLLTRTPAEARSDASLLRFALTNLLFAAMRAHKRAMESQAEDAPLSLAGG